MPPFVTDYLLPDLEEKVESLGIRRYRARQIASWVYRRGVRTYEEMTDLPREARDRLNPEIPVRSLEVRGERASPDGTVKLLVGLADGNLIETVVIPEDRRVTACISTQVGCPVACVFCASGLDGLKRNLAAGEIVEQVLLAREAAAKRGARLTHHVFMGIGEPLLNYDATARALKILHATWGAGIGYNKLSLSTAGIVDKIARLAEDGVTPNLAVSLHAPNDELRRRLVPHVRQWGVKDLVAAAKAYREKTKKEVMFEYVLLAGVNDRPEHAKELAGLLAGSGCKVNVIPYNRVEGLPYARPDDATAWAFGGALVAGGVRAMIRRARGDAVAAACGQLRAKAMEAAVGGRG